MSSLSSSSQTVRESIVHSFSRLLNKLQSYKGCREHDGLELMKKSFCRQYHSWVLAMLLGQQSQVMHSVPMVAFKIANFTSFGYSCMPDKVPVDRKLTFPVASNLYKDSEELLRNLHMAPYTKPIVSLIDDFPIHQRHKGWQFGYLINDTAKQVCTLCFNLWSC